MNFRALSSVLEYQKDLHIYFKRLLHENSSVPQRLNGKEAFSSPKVSATWLGKQFWRNSESITPASNRTVLLFFSFGTTRGARNIWGGEEKYQKATEMPFEAEFKGIYDINTKQVVYVCGSRWGTYVGTQKTEHAIILTPFPQVLKIGTVSTSSTWQQELSMLTRNPTHTILSQHRSFPLYFSIPSVLPSPTMVVSWGTVWHRNSPSFSLTQSTFQMSSIPAHTRLPPSASRGGCSHSGHFMANPEGHIACSIWKIRLCCSKFNHF